MTPDPESLVALGARSEVLALLRESAEDVLTREWDPSRTRDLLDGEGPTWAPPLWERLRGLGWADLLIPEAHGGSGGTVSELCVLAEAVGASTAPVPLVAVCVANGCLARTAPSAVPCVPIIGAAWSLTCSAGEHRLSGHHPFVAYGNAADSFVTAAHCPDLDILLVQVDANAPGVTSEPLDPLDGMPCAAVTFDDVNVDHVRIVERGPSAARRWHAAELTSTVAWTAELTGLSAAANDLAVDYAKHRIAFGRPIGSFQAIKHRLVNQRAAIEVAHALWSRAAVALDGAAPDASALTALAAFWAIDQLRAVPEGAIQVFGGIGYTWEHVAHVFLRRAAVLSALLGPSARHREVVVPWLSSRRSDPRST